MVEIRNYQTSDYFEVKEVLELTDLYWDVTDNEKSLNRESEKDPSSYLVAIEDGRVAGTQFAMPGFIPFLFRLAVHPQYQGKGIGKFL